MIAIFAFNRTTFGIETVDLVKMPADIISLLIEPLLELKLFSVAGGVFPLPTFNRTTFGIETCKYQ